jgi:hypothetical protein
MSAWRDGEIVQPQCVAGRDVGDIEEQWSSRGHELGQDVTVAISTSLIHAAQPCLFAMCP